MGLLLGGRERRSGSTFPEPVIPPVRGGDMFGGSSVGNNPEQALTIPAVWACVSLISNAVSMLPLQTYRRAAPNGVPKRMPDPPLLVNPSSDFTQAEWLHMLLVSLLLRGNGIGYITLRDDETAFPLKMRLLNPDTVKMAATPDGSRSYRIVVDGVEKPVSTDDIWHVRGMTMPGTWIGLAPIAYAADTLWVDIAARKFSSDFFAGGGIPKAIIKSNQSINQQQSRTLKDRLLAATRSREPLVLADGLEYMPVSVKPEESQFLLTHQMTVTDVARFFGVPAGLIGGSEGGSMTYSNVEQRSLDFLVHCIQPWLQRLEQAIGALLPSNVYVKFDTSALLRTDAETQAKVHVQLLAGKVLTPTEVRASYDLPPMTPSQKIEADMVPLTVTPMGGAKALPALKEPPGAAAPDPANDPAAQGVVSASS